MCIYKQHTTHTHTYMYMKYSHLFGLYLIGCYQILIASLLSQSLLSKILKHFLHPLFGFSTILSAWSPVGNEVISTCSAAAQRSTNRSSE